MVRYLSDLARFSPAGYSVGLHIRFAAPLYFRSTYPESWRSLYAEQNFALRDPLVFWGISTAGTTRWSAITLPDPFNIMQQARDHGLVFGAVCSVGRITSRSIVGVSRADREFTDAELSTLTDLTENLHKIAEPPDDVTPAMIEALRLVDAGYLHPQAAEKLHITEDALHERLMTARQCLGAETTAEALQMAKEYRLI